MLPHPLLHGFGGERPGRALFIHGTGGCFGKIQGYQAAQLRGFAGSQLFTEQGNYVYFGSGPVVLYQGKHRTDKLLKFIGANCE